MNAQSRVIEGALSGYGIPYRVYGGMRFYERQEVKDIIAYMRLMANPADDVAFRRVINVPKRGMGQAALSELERAAQNSAMPLLLVAAEAQNIPEISPRVAAKASAFASVVMDAMAKLESEPLSGIIRALVDKLGYYDYLREDKKENYLPRQENVQELIGAVGEYEALAGKPDVLNDFLENIALVSDTDNIDERGGAVMLMTLHSAKGLEFPNVFLSGMEENVFPHARAYTDVAQMEEERRLCYVGITRAKRHLYLTMARSRMIFGDIKQSRPSRFLSEIPDELFAQDEPEPVSPRFSFSSTPKAETPKFQMRAEPAPSAPRDASVFELYQRVRHPKFGDGTIAFIEGEGGGMILTIDFDKVGTKRLAASFAPVVVIK
ncbi:ATP-dependent DNA helicase PcrA [bioreactor metagenome]|uniref:ATP-dependent DNA helicase PcrA n=1 Tax=bioreactor metagenome TaxID=1076179 RepID=A0A645D2M8_9ZZZZ